MYLLASLSLVVLSAFAEEEEDRLADLEEFKSRPATKPFSSMPTSKPFHRPRRPPISGIRAPGVKPFVSKPATNPFKAAGDMMTGTMPPMTTTMPPMTTSMPPMTTTMPPMTTTPAPAGKWYNVSVGYGPNGMAFTPKTVYLQAGDWVRWIWVSDGHNVMSGTCGNHDMQFCSNATSCSDSFNTGFIYSKKFTANGVYPYYCGPHCASNMTGTVIVGPRTLNVTVKSNSVFQPSSLWVHKGDTVNWIWEGSDHNVISGSCGVADGKFCSTAGASCASTLYSAGHEFANTFTEAGWYNYHCGPHCGSGMVGSVEVGPRWHNVSVGNGNATFIPAMLNVKAGDWVTWTFTDGGHSIISGDACTDDGKWCCTPGACTTPRNAGWSYSKQFNFPGTFPYFCAQHCVGMNGVVMVTEPMMPM